MEKPVALMELENVWHDFAGVQALSDVSLAIKPGEIIGLLGDNGAGKTTLLKILAGNFPPARGRLRFAGEELSFRSAADARARGIEAVYQDLALCDNLTAAANVFLGRELNRDLGPLRILDHSAMDKATRKLFETLQSETPPGELARNLSGGQRQAVAIARALLSTPKLLLLDEPIAALSPRQSAELLAILQRLGRQRIAIVFVSHALADVTAVADRIVVLRRGRKVMDRPVFETSLPELAELVSGRS
jgi:simple sugar transport system ATP-binding protein